MDTTGSGLDREALDAQVRGGLKWVSLAVIGLELSAMGTTVFMARLVAPSDYGRAVIALIVPVIASILTYEGFGTPLVQRAEVTDRHIETATFVSLVSGVVLSGLVVGFALTIAEPIFGKGMAGLFELASPAFLIVGSSAVPRAMLCRSLSWRLMNGSDVGGAVISGIVSITLALCGLEARSIVIGALAGAVATTLLLWIGARPVRPRFHLQETREIVAFGANTSIAGVAGTIRRNIDYIVLATRISPHLVGIYWRGFSTGVDYQSKISGVTGRVSMTVLPRAGHADDLHAVRGHLVRLNTIIVFPFLGILVATAPWAIPAIYGARWSEAVVPTQVLAVGGMAWAMLAGVEGITVAAGHPGVLAVFNCVSLVLVGLVAWFVAPFGVDMVAVAMAGLELVFLLIAQYWILWRTVGIPLRDTFRDPAPAVICTAIMVAVIAPIASLLGAHLPALLNVGVCGLLGLLVYGAAVRLVSPSGWSILRSLLQALAPARRVRAVRRRLAAA
jgi:O-antigen/teichoic acid export membrane protein